MTSAPTTSAPVEMKQARRPRWMVTASAAAVVAIAMAVVVPQLGDRDSSPGTGTVAAPLVLSLGEDDSLASCMMFDVAVLAQMPVAFEGTVTGVDGERITMAVDHWFKGGDSATVELTAPSGLGALIGGIDFAAGSQYLVTATEGSVNYCGYTGPSTPEYRAAFVEAFSS